MKRINIRQYSFIAIAVVILLVAITLPAKKISRKDPEPKLNTASASKFHLKASVSVKNEADLSYASNELTWSNRGVIGPPAPGWTSESETHTWRPDSLMESVAVPLEQNDSAKNIPINSLDKIQIEYQNMFPENPVKPLIKLLVSKRKTGPLVDKKKPIKKTVYTFKETRSHFSQKRAKPKDSVSTTTTTTNTKGISTTNTKGLVSITSEIKDLITVSSASWKKKNKLYLIKRALGLGFDPTWFYSKSTNNTVFQRRFHKDLQSTETIDFVFSNDVTKEQLDRVRVNFRIAYADPAKTLHVIAHRDLVSGYDYRTDKSSIIEIQGKKAIRFMVGDFVRKAYRDRKTVFLEEMIVFFPGAVEEVARKRPVELILFQEQTINEGVTATNILDISSTLWKEIDNFYLIRRELGISPDVNWHYRQDGKNAVFKKRFHKNLHTVEGMDIILNEKVVEDTHLHCQVRIGFNEHSRSSEAINCRDLPWEVFEFNGNHVLRVQLNELVRKRYSQEKEMVFLEELTVYLPGMVEPYIRNDLLQAIQFYTLPDYYEAEIIKLIAKKKIEYIREQFSRYKQGGASKFELEGMVEFISEEVVNYQEGESVRVELEAMIRFFEAKISTYKEGVIAESQLLIVSELKGAAQLRWKKIVKLFEKRMTKTPGSSLISKNTPSKSMQTQILSWDSKQITINLRDIVRTLDKNSKLESITLSAKPTDSKLRSGFRLLRARTITQRGSKIQSVFAPEMMMTRQWGGPFLSLKENVEKFERLQVNAYYPFEKMGRVIAYRSDRETHSGVSVQTDDNSVFRFSDSNEGLVCDFWFFSKNALATLMFSGVGPFEEDHNIALNWEHDESLQVDVVDFPYIGKKPWNVHTWEKKSNRMEFLLKKGTQPIFRIRAAENSFVDPDRGIRGRLIIKSIKGKGSVAMRYNLGSIDRSALGMRGMFLKEVRIVENMATAQLTQNRPVDKIVFQAQKKRLPEKSVKYFSDLEFKKKNYIYQIKRALGLSFDKAWRYDEDDGNFVFQRRFHKDISSVEALDLFILPNAKIEKGFHPVDEEKYPCSIGVSFNSDSLITDEVVDCMNLPLSVMTVQGQKIIRINLKKWIQKKKVEGIKNIFLGEFRIWLPMRSDFLIPEWPLEKIIFQGRGQGTYLKPIEILGLSFKGTKSFEGPNLIPDSRDFSSSLWKEKEFLYEAKRVLDLPLDSDWRYSGNKGMVTFQKRFNKNLDSIQNMDLYLSAGASRDKIPQILCELRFGYESRFLPDRVFSCSKFFDQTIKSGQEFSKIFSKSEPDSSKKTSSIRSRDMMISAENPFDRWVTLANGLELEGDGEWIEFDWLVKTRLKKDTRFFMEISEGAESIESMQVTPVTGEDQLASISANPNQPVRLNFPGKNIDRLKVRFKLHEDNYFFRIVLQGVALFEPVVVTEVQALDISFPEEMEALLIPERFQSDFAGKRNIGASQHKVTRFPVLEMKGKKIFPGSLVGLTAEEIVSRENWLDLGLHFMATSNSLVPDFRILEHPYLKINTIVAEKITLHKNDGLEPILKSDDHTVLTSGLLWMNLARKALFLLGVFVVVRWVWMKGWWFVALQTLKANRASFGNCGQQILAWAGRMLSIICGNLVFLNRLVGFAGGVIIALGVLRISDSHFIAGVLIILGALWHKLRQNALHSESTRTWWQTMCFGRDREIPKLVYFLSIVTITWVGWQVIHLASHQYSVSLISPVFSMAYFYLPWFGWFWRYLPRHGKQPRLFWLAVAGGIYSMGILAQFGGMGLYSFLNILSLGSLAMIPVWGYWVKDVRLKIEHNWPDLAKMIYAEEGTPYVAGFIVLLIPTVLSRITHLDKLAEQFTMFGLYLLIVGVVFKIKELFKTQKYSSSTNACHPVDE
jgi:hypothetical protein